MEIASLLIQKIELSTGELACVLTLNPETQPEHLPLDGKVYEISFQAEAFVVTECDDHFSGCPSVSAFNLDFNLGDIEAGKFRASFGEIEGRIHLQNLGFGIADIADATVDPKCRQLEPQNYQISHLYDLETSPIRITMANEFENILLVATIAPALDSGVKIKIKKP